MADVEVVIWAPQPEEVPETLADDVEDIVV
jgi:hypothetical protein